MGGYNGEEGEDKKLLESKLFIRWRGIKNNKTALYLFFLVVNQVGEFVPKHGEQPLILLFPDCNLLLNALFDLRQLSQDLLALFLLQQQLATPVIKSVGVVLPAFELLPSRPKFVPGHYFPVDDRV